MRKMPYPGLVNIDPSGVARLKVAVPGITAFGLAIADWLFHLGFMSESQVILVLGHFKETIAKIEANIAQPIVATNTLLIADYKWCGISGDQRFLNLDTFETADTLASRPTTVVSCYLQQLFDRTSRIDINGDATHKSRNHVQTDAATTATGTAAVGRDIRNTVDLDGSGPVRDGGLGVGPGDDSNNPGT